MYSARRLVFQGLAHYWRTNIAVVLGVATAVAVLAGALLVGDSVRGSLRDLILQRLGRTDQIVVSAGFFREALAVDLRADPAFSSMFDGICPLVVAQAFVTEPSGGRRAGQVRLYGVDDRFWQFHGVAGVHGPADRDALVSPALASEIGAQPGAAILVRVQRPSDIPLESLHSRKDDSGRTLRLNVRAVLAPASLGEFSLQPQQGDVRAVFVSLKRLQQDLGIVGRVNTLLTAEGPAAAGHDRGSDEAGHDRGSAAEGPANAGHDRDLAGLVRKKADLADVGLKIRALDQRHAIVVEADAGVLDDPRLLGVFVCLVRLVPPKV